MSRVQNHDGARQAEPDDITRSSLAQTTPKPGPAAGGGTGPGLVETHPPDPQNGLLEIIEADDVHTFIGYVTAINTGTVMANYYLHTYKQPLRHCEASEMAQRAYRAADAFLQRRGVTNNSARQAMIHLAEELL